MRVGASCYLPCWQWHKHRRVRFQARSLMPPAQWFRTPTLRSKTRRPALNANLLRTTQVALPRRHWWRANMKSRRRPKAFAPRCVNSLWRPVPSCALKCRWKSANKVKSSPSHLTARRRSIMSRTRSKASSRVKRFRNCRSTDAAF